MAQKIQASTQKFTEIVDFSDNIVVMTGGKACLIIEITASNFSLLSKKEQDARVFSYASLLNSLSFPIQILIRNKKMDISSYVKELDEIVKNAKNEKLAKYMQEYSGFIKSMMTANEVLNKEFYIIVPYSSLEAGIKVTSDANMFAQTAGKALEAKANSVLSQLTRFAVTARVLEKDDLIKLFYGLYNENDEIDTDYMDQGVSASIVKGETQQ